MQRVLFKRMMQSRVTPQVTLQQLTQVRAYASPPSPPNAGGAVHSHHQDSSIGSAGSGDASVVEQLVKRMGQNEKAAQQVSQMVNQAESFKENSPIVLDTKMLEEGVAFVNDIKHRLAQVKHVYEETNPDSFERQFYPDSIIEIATPKFVFSIDGDQITQELQTENFQDCGHIVFKYDEPRKFHCNGRNIGSVHGGALATWTDLTTSMAIYAFDKKQRSEWVSLNISQDYPNAAMPGKALYMKATVSKIGRSLAFADCQIMDQNFRTVSTGTHKMTYIEPKV